MSNILRVKDDSGNWIDIPAIIGPTGPQGPTGAKGPTGANGNPATINGNNAITLSAGDGLSGTWTGTTYTLALDLDNYDGGMF